MKRNGETIIMSKQYDPDIVSVIDEDGKEHTFEELDRIETDKGKYVALLPIFLKVSEENGETYLAAIEDDAEFEEVGNLFEDRLIDLFELEEGESEEQ